LAQRHRKLTRHRDGAIRPDISSLERGPSPCPSLAELARGFFASRSGSPPVFDAFLYPGDRRPMADADEKLTRRPRRDLADALAFALRFQGRKRVQNADEIN